MARNDHYGIVVGIRLYPALGPLEGPCDDARAFYDWLIDPAGGDVRDRNVRLLVSDDFHPPDPAGAGDAHPGMDEVNDLFRPHVTAALQRPNVGERLYIYLAGHGFTERLEESTAVYTANAEPGFALNVAGTVYAEWFRRCAAFREIVLVMDCCRFAHAIHSIGAPPLPRCARPELASAVRRFLGYATSWGRAARERKMNGGVRGIFTTALVDALRHAPPNRYGRVTGQVLKDYVHNHVTAVAGDAAIEPPEIRVDPDRDIVFVERPLPPPITVRVRLEPFAGAEAVVIRQDRDEIDRQTAEGPEVVFRLQPGIYKALVADTERSRLFEVVRDDVAITL